MSQPADQPSPDPAQRWRRASAWVNWAQAAGLVAVAAQVAVAAPHTKGWTADVPRSRVAVSEVAVYLVFAAAVAWLGWRVRLGRGRVWTPCALIQVFTLVAGWPLVTSDQPGYRFAGVATLAVGLFGLLSVGLWLRHDPGAPTGAGRTTN